MKEKKWTKPVYKSPKVFKLDEAESFHGVAGQCESGSGDTDCDTGSSAGSCGNGNSALGACAHSGNSAGTMCPNGNGGTPTGTGRPQK